MSTPRTMDSLKRAAERAGEKLYEHRRQAVLAAAKAVEARQPASQAAGDNDTHE